MIDHFVVVVFFCFFVVFFVVVFVLFCLLFFFCCFFGFNFFSFTVHVYKEVLIFYNSVQNLILSCYVLIFLFFCLFIPVYTMKSERDGVLNTYIHGCTRVYSQGLAHVVSQYSMWCQGQSYVLASIVQWIL